MSLLTDLFNLAQYNQPTIINFTVTLIGIDHQAIVKERKEQD